MSDECMYAWIRKSDLERCNADLDRLEAENAKLREYASALAKSTLYGPCDLCPYEDDEGACDCDTLPMRDGCKFRDELRKLGVETDR